MQLANLAAIVANRGYYYIPHIVKKIEGQDSLDRRFYERHYTKVDPKHFEPIVDGMWRGVNVGGTSTAARLEGLDVCGKTGTAERADENGGYLKENYMSSFMGFAPTQSPKVLCYITLDGTPSGSDAAAVPFQSIMANALDVLGIPRTK